MSDYMQFTNQELSEALDFHRRQRNMSRGINEAAHARQTQMVRLLEAEEARRLDEAVSVDKKNYDWGKMITVRHGSSHSFPLHPKHQEMIKNLKDGEATAFKDETGSHVTASREGDKIHLKLRGANQKTTVSHSHFTEEAEQIDEISTELKKRYVEKGAQDVVDRFTGRGKYERPHNPAHFTKTGRVKKSALNRPEAIKYREKLDNRRDIVNKVSQEVHGKKRFGEEVEINEETMPGNVALRLADRHYNAATYHKLRGNIKGYAAHMKHGSDIEDAVIRAGSNMPVRSKRIEAKSDKIFAEHPHNPNK